MSTKTIYKRIALVAVAALGAGVLSVAPANASTDAPVAGKLYLGTESSTTGTATLALTFNDAATGTYADHATGLSVGFISATAAVSTGSVAGVILPTAQLSFVGTTATNIAFTVSGGVVRSADATSAAAEVVSSDLTSVFNDTAEATAIVASPTGAVGSTMTVSMFTGANVSATAPTAGVLVGSFTFTVAAASASGAYSPTYSAVYSQIAKNKGTAADGVLQYDTLAAANSGQVNNIYILLKDAYGSALATGTIAASATDGAKILFGAAGTEGYTASASFDTVAANGSVKYLNLIQATSGVASTSTVTITYNGAVVATKTVKWNGDAASITLDPVNSNSIFLNGATAATAVLGIKYVVKDAAGNTINWTSQPSLSDGTGSMIAATLDATNDGTASVAQTPALGGGATTMIVPASDLYGAGTYRLKITSGAGTSIYSAVQNATVSGTPYTFVASWNKATYASGEIAELTITAKDSKGNLVADGRALGAESLVTVNTDGLQSVTAACDAANIATTTYSGGKKVCKFAVKNTAGAYAYTVVVPTGSDQSATAGTITVSAGSATSNADVLKAIVSLIASINKQIAALQKALLKKK